MSDSGSIHSIFPHIRYRAQLAPHTLAVLTDSARISYETFCEHIERVTRRLHACAIAPTARVAVHVADPYLGWLVTLGLGRLALLSAALSNASATLPLLKPGAVIADRTGGLDRYNVIKVDDGWYRQPADELPAIVDRPQPRDTPVRIVMSSGTTGKPKLALVTLGQLRSRMAGSTTIGPETRLLVTMGPSSLGGYQTPVTCWSAGASVVLASQGRGRPMWDLLAFQPNMLVVAPAQLQDLLAGMPANAQPLPDLLVYVGGAELPRALNRNARLRLTPKLIMAYGSTEAGGVAAAHALEAEARPGFSGFVMPTAQVEIVDAQDSPVPHGTTGEVRIRAEGMIDTYLDEDDTDDRPLRGGWFYPGDAGTLDADGGLCIVGRIRELINVGGTKISPTYVEQVLDGIAGVDDLAVFALETAAGVRAAVAVVAGEGFETDRMAARFRHAFPNMPPVVLARVQAIPRNAMGKVLRTQLAESVRGAALKKQRSAPADAG